VTKQASVGQAVPDSRTSRQRAVGSRQILLRCCGVLITTLSVLLPSAAAQPPEKKVVIPFDFVSKFDAGHYGRKIGQMIWKKLEREGGFVIPETMADVRDTVAAGNLRLAPDTPLDKVARIVRDDFDAQIAIWGSVERVAGQRWDVYDLRIRCVDFSTRPKPTVIYSIDARTKTVSEIPHRYVKQLLDKLHGRKPGALPPTNKHAEENWRKNPNLVNGGDFEKAAGGVPHGWNSRGGQKREPLGKLVRRVPERGNAANHVIRLAFDKALGDSFGVMYYSDFFPVEEGATYRFQCRWRTDGPAAKVFIKCYDQTDSSYRRGRSVDQTAPARRGYVPQQSQRRECYRSQQNLKGPRNTWNMQTEDFTPRHTKYTPRWGRVMLYGYLGAGSVEFDDVVVKQIIPASPGGHDKRRRHSLETGVTIKEMEENERRGTKPSDPPGRQPKR